jgi:hypothetical protein
MGCANLHMMATAGFFPPFCGKVGDPFEPLLPAVVNRDDLLHSVPKALAHQLYELGLAA